MKYNIRVFFLIESTIRVQGDLTRFARQCFGSNVFDTLQRSASTVQSYLEQERNISASQFKIPGILC